MPRFQFSLTIDYGETVKDMFDATGGTIGTAEILRKLADRLDVGGDGPFDVPVPEGVRISADYDYA